MIVREKSKIIMLLTKSSVFKFEDLQLKQTINCDAKATSRHVIIFV